jgi:hypothetical protein
MEMWERGKAVRKVLEGVPVGNSHLIANYTVQFFPVTVLIPIGCKGQNVLIKN